MTQSASTHAPVQSHPHPLSLTPPPDTFIPEYEHLTRVDGVGGGWDIFLDFWTPSVASSKPVKVASIRPQFPQDPHRAAMEVVAVAMEAFKGLGFKVDAHGPVWGGVRNIVGVALTDVAQFQLAVDQAQADYRQRVGK